MKPRSCTGPSRRDVLRFGSVALGSAALGPLVPYGARGANPQAARTSNDPAVIFVWLPGGPAHMDTFDMKPDSPAEYRGPFKPIRTKVPGIDVCEHLPQLAAAADKYSLIRSVHHRFFDHGGGHKKFLTGRDPKEPTGFVNDYPMVGSMAAEALKGRRAPVPSYIAEVDSGRQGIDTYSFGSSYLGPAAHPFVVAGDPSEGRFEMKNITLAKANEGTLARRLEILQRFDADVPDLKGTSRGMDLLRGRALELLTTDTARGAFDLAQEPAKLRERYGMHRYGQRALMARRLVEHGASWVTLGLENATPPGQEMKKDHTYNWDSHAVNCHIFEDSKYKLGFLDRAISALIEDLFARGLDRRVLLVVTGEFGRTPKIEYKEGRPGRDHWASAMSILVSGGGLKMGQVVGSTTSKAEMPKDRPLTPNDLWATVFRHLGVDFERTSFLDGTGRPMPLLADGDAISELI